MTAGASSGPKPNGSALPLLESKKSNGSRTSHQTSSQSLTPAPSSDAVEVAEEGNEESVPLSSRSHAAKSLPSPITPASVIKSEDQEKENLVPKGFYSPSRKVVSSILSCIIGIDVFYRPRELSAMLSISRLTTTVL